MFALIVAAALQAAAPTSDARQLTLAPPQAIVEVDTGKVKGDLSRLAWSPDASQLYLETVERDSRFNVKSMKRYVISVGSKAMKNVGEEPAWVSKYWSWKSDKKSPSSPAFSIAASSREEVVRSTAAPVGGAMAKGGLDTGGTTLADAAGAAENTQNNTIWTLKVKGETIGEWTNEPVLPGTNFSWAPEPLHMIVFARRDGGPLVVLDDGGHKQELAGAKAAFLPAWSDDGTRIAWLERKDKKKFVLSVAEIGSR